MFLLESETKFLYSKVNRVKKVKIKCFTGILLKVEWVPFEHFKLKK